MTKDQRHLLIHLELRAAQAHLELLQEALRAQKVDVHVLARITAHLFESIIDASQLHADSADR